MNGVLMLLKPPGITSSGAVGFIKKMLNTKKVGHAGTLDPGACGVLVVLVGKGTKLSDYLMDGDKTYIGEITFGWCTDTQDAYGQITDKSDEIVSEKDILKVLPQFIGKISQTPSRFSAIKVDGQKAYHMARKGIDFKLKSRTVNIDNIKLLAQTDTNQFLLKVSCSKGTYIRALFEDIGKALNTCAYMSFLERTGSGEFCVDSAYTMEEIKKAVATGQQNRLLMPLDEVLKEYPIATVADSEYKRIANGLNAQVIDRQETINSNTYRIYCKQAFLGLGSVVDDKAKVTMHLLGEK